MMKISTRGRYAVRVMVDMASRDRGEAVTIKDVAERQSISKKYLEGIMADLSKVGLIEGRHGKGGGYKLTREPIEYNIGEILRVTEGDLVPVPCADGSYKCEMQSHCATTEMWKGLYRLVNKYFDGITLESLVRGEREFDYII